MTTARASDAEVRRFLDDLWNFGAEQEIPGSYTDTATEQAMLRSAIDSGTTDENQLANLLFFHRHPDRNGRLLVRGERNFGRLSEEWIQIRDTLVRPALRDARNKPPPAPNLVLISGGPGPYDDRDVEHDKSWANYVTPPLLLTDTAQKRAAFIGPATEVWWLVFRPAYLARWLDDVADGRGSVSDVRKQGFDSYTALLEARARDRGWRLLWFESATDLWTRLASVGNPIERVWFWGHARDDLWLTLAHAADARAIRPPATAVVTTASIAGHAALRSSFGAGRAHRFVGCNTAAFASEWSSVFGVAAEGVEGKVDFSGIHATGGDPTLVGAARWRAFGAAVPQRTP